MKILTDHSKIALVYKKKQFSFADLIPTSTSYKELMQKTNPQRVMIFSENRPEWIFAFYGAWMNDATAVPVDMMSSASEVNYMVNDCRPEIIFSSKDRSKILQEALENINYQPEVFIFDELNELPDPIEPHELIVEDFNKTAVIIYTSGTTGSPKGVMLSFENLEANMIAVSEDIKIYSRDERVMILLPLHHIFPLLGTMTVTFYTGATGYMAPSITSEAIIKTLQEHKITIMIGVPRLYEMMRKGIMGKISESKLASRLFSMAKFINSRKFSKTLFKTVHKKFGGELKYMVCGGAPLDAAVANDFKTLGFEMLEGFGMTEAAPMISFTRPGKWKIGAAGQLMPCTKVEIRDGEIVASGKNIMQGYYNRPEETDEVIKDGWLYTGDLGEVDKNGYLKITGRKKEIIILSNGKNINPSPIEAQLTESIEGIKEVGVLLHNDKLHAIIHPDDEYFKTKGINDLNEHFKNQLNELYNNKVAPYKKIPRFTLIDENLPRTRLEKLQRFKLEELLTRGSSGKKSDFNEEYKEYKIIKTFLEEYKNTQISPNDNIDFDLSLDSLDKVTFQSFIESSFGVDLKMDKFKNFPNVLKLAEYVSEKKNKIRIESVNWSKILKEKIHVKLPKSSIFGQFSTKATKYFFKVYFRYKIKGIENIPSGPCIFTSNHQSYLDGFFIASALRRKTFKRTLFYAKEKHLRRRWLKALAKNNNIIVMDYDNDLKLSIQKMAESLRLDKNVVIFPEGTRTKDGSLGTFKDTFAILSKELNLPIVPVVIDGAFNTLPRGSRFPKPFKEIQVEFIEPVFPQNESYEEINNRVRNLIQSKLEKEI